MSEHSSTEPTVLPVKWANTTLRPDYSTFRVLVAVNRPGTWAVLDHRRFNELKKWNWQATADGYFWRQTPTGPMWLHREIVDAMSHEFVAFKNGDKRDCRKANLQLVARKEQAKGLEPLPPRHPKTERSLRIGVKGFRGKRAKRRPTAMAA